MAFYDGQPEDNEEKGKCFVCGENPDAFWAGHTTVFICCACAVETLPKLTADSIMNKLTLCQIVKDSIFRHFKRENDILLSLARGFECAILRKIKEHYI